MKIKTLEEHLIPELGIDELTRKFSHLVPGKNRIAVVPPLVQPVHITDEEKELFVIKTEDQINEEQGSVLMRKGATIVGVGEGVDSSNTRVGAKVFMAIGHQAEGQYFDKDTGYHYLVFSAHSVAIFDNSPSYI